MVFSELRSRLTRAVPISLRRRVWFWRKFGRTLRLRQVSTFNEKVNWRIIKDRRPQLEGTCDKLAMKARAVAEVPALRVPETYWSGTDVAELAGVPLPERWVLKPNHRTGLVLFGEGPADVADLAERTRGWTEGLHWRSTGEWAYRSARPCLLVEEHIGGSGEVPDDYKVFVFDGVPQVVTVHSGRFTEHRTSSYLPDWTPWVNEDESSPSAPHPRPDRLEDMLKSAAVLAEDLDMLRVDFYEVDGELWFGEITPYPGAGLLRRDPEWDGVAGRWWTLPDLPSPSRRLWQAVAPAGNRST